MIRLPNDWNGKLAVAGASGTRSEFNGDFAWSDYVLPKGYAYASQNKGVLEPVTLRQYDSRDAAGEPIRCPCRLNPDPPVFSNFWVHFFDNDPQKPFTQWTQYMLQRRAASAQSAVKVNYNHFPRRTYAVGTSNGGYQVRRAMEEAPNLFDGGVDWEGTFVDPNGPNILIDLPPAIKNFPDVRASGSIRTARRRRTFVAAGYPPDIVNRQRIPSGACTTTQFWEVTAVPVAGALRPDGHVLRRAERRAGTGGYDYFSALRRMPVDLRQP